MEVDHYYTPHKDHLMFDHQTHKDMYSQHHFQMLSGDKEVRLAEFGSLVVRDDCIVPSELATSQVEGDYLFLGDAPFGSALMPDKKSAVNGELGRGEFGVVRLCVERSSGEVFACKRVGKKKLIDRNRTQDVLMEIYAMHVIPPHPNIVRMHSVHEDREAVHVVMDMCAGGDLFDLISRAHRLREREAAWAFRQIVSAVQHSHNWGIAHLDIKPENILLQVNAPLAVGSDLSGGNLHPHYNPSQPLVSVKLSDYGQAVLLGEGEKAVGLAGSVYYMAPEVVALQGYDFSADVWSLGVLLYAMLSGTLPFHGNGPEQVFPLIRNKHPRFSSKSWSSISPSAISLVKSMLNKDPKQRPSIDSILHHEWLVNPQFDVTPYVDALGRVKQPEEVFLEYLLTK